MMGWLRRILGLGRRDGARALPRVLESSGRSSPAARSRARATATPRGEPPYETLSPEEFKLARRRVVLYISRARVPIRQAAATRQAWIQDLGKVYEAIRTSPTEMILDRAGEVAMRYEEAFRDALSMAQSLEVPSEAEVAHGPLVQWLTNLHSSCLALIDARRLKDRSMLGMFRERLGQARRQAVQLTQARDNLFTDYRLRLDPNLKRKKAEKEAPETPATEAATSAAAAQAPAGTPASSAPVLLRRRRPVRRGRVRATPRLAT